MTTPVHPPRLATAAILVVLAGCGGGGGGGGSPHAAAPTTSRPSSTPTTEEPVAAAALAAMDERSSHVGEYRDLLGTLQTRCTQLPNRIADFAVDAQRRMSDHGRQETMAAVLRAMIAAIPAGQAPGDCAAVAIEVAHRLAP